MHKLVQALSNGVYLSYKKPISNYENETDQYFRIISCRENTQNAQDLFDTRDDNYRNYLLYHDFNIISRHYQYR